MNKFTLKIVLFISVILLPAHPASFTRNLSLRCKVFYFREFQDAMALQACHEK